MKIEYFCPECDGTNVRVMCMWDKETQQWEYAEDGGDWCDDCDEQSINKTIRDKIKSGDPLEEWEIKWMEDGFYER